MENAADVIAQDEVIKFSNPKTLEMIGYSVGKLAKKPFRAMVLERHRRRLKGEKPPSTYSFRVIDRDGEELWVQLDTVVISCEGVNLNFLRDVTEQSKLEAQFEAAQRMESSGHLSWRHCP